MRDERIDAAVPSHNVGTRWPTGEHVDLVQPRSWIRWRRRWPAQVDACLQVIWASDGIRRAQRGCPGMSATIQVQAIIPVDCETYRKHAEVRRACVAADVTLPPDTVAFFGDTDDEIRLTTPTGIVVSIDWGHDPAATGDLMSYGKITIDLAKLPDGATHIRVSASA